jgi:hypothetical protein
VLTQTLQCLLVLAQVALVFLNSSDAQLTTRSIIPTQWVSPVGFLLSHLTDLQDRHVECTASKVEHGMLILLLIESIVRGGGRSLMMRRTSSPAILPASFVAWRWLSLKYAGTVITACVTA